MKKYQHPPVYGSVLSQKGIELKPEFELATSDMIVQFARRNMGVGCVMEGFAEEAIERGEVFALSFKEKCRPVPSVW